MRPVTTCSCSKGVLEDVQRGLPFRRRPGDFFQEDTPPAVINLRVEHFPVHPLLFRLHAHPISEPFQADELEVAFMATYRYDEYHSAFN